MHAELLTENVELRKRLDKAHSAGEIGYSHLLRSADLNMLKVIPNNMNLDSKFINTALLALYRDCPKMLNERSVRATVDRVVVLKDGPKFIEGKKALSPENLLAIKQLFYDRLQKKSDQGSVQRPDVYLNRLIATNLDTFKRKLPY